MNPYLTDCRNCHFAFDAPLLTVAHEQRMGVDVAAMLQDMFERDSVLEVDDPLHQLPALPSSSTKPADVCNDGKTRNGSGRSKQSLLDDSNEIPNKSKKAPKVRNIKVSCLRLGVHCLAHPSYIYHLTDTVNCQCVLCVLKFPSQRFREIC